MYILGINGNIGRESHDPAAVIIKDGEVVFAAEEERYNGIKHSKGYIPIQAIKKGLDFLKINMDEIDYLAIPQVSWGQLFEERLEAVFNHWFGCCPKIKKFHHHLSHAAAAYYGSGFDGDAIVYSIDGSGDAVSVSAYLFNKSTFEELKIAYFPNSLGLFYSLVTQYLGFYKNSDEYKVMSLAALGNPKYDLSKIINYSEDRLIFNDDFMSKIIKRLKYPLYGTQQEPFYSSYFEELCSRRLPGEDIKQEHKDLAASLQKHFEEININIVRQLVESTGCKNVILSGGSMLNCKLVGKILRDIQPNYFYIGFAPDDAGTSIGAAMLATLSLDKYPLKINSAFLGDEIKFETIKEILDKNKIKYECISGAEKYSRLILDILEEKIVAHFSGRMEFGPRALGNRSILANARSKGITKRLNNLKKRYSFQPFALAIKEERVNEYFYNYGYDSPYMNIAFVVKEDKRVELSNVLHEDGTIRVQTVNSTSDELDLILDRLWLDFKIPYVINTSFNMKGRPIISSVEDALGMFYATELDVLYVGNFRITKE